MVSALHLDRDPLGLSRQPRPLPIGFALREIPSMRGGGYPRPLPERWRAATGKDIDQFLYEPYGLTDDEIAIVEKAAKGKAWGKTVGP